MIGNGRNRLSPTCQIHIMTRSWLLVVLCLLSAVLFGQVTRTYGAYDTLAEAYQAAGLNPCDPNCYVFAAASDCHYKYTETNPVRPFIDEINAMNPLPEFLLITGDIITSASSNMGNIPTESKKTRALAEYQMAKADLDRLLVRYELTLGNHDNYPYETPFGDLFHSAFEDRPLYKSFDFGGIHFILLHAHACGNIKDIDPAQWQWLLNDMASVPPEQVVICAQHYPWVGANVEHGVSRAMTELLPNHTGNVWMLCGHDHPFRERVYALPNTTIVEHCMGESRATNTNADRGYFLYFLKDAAVLTRIWREYDVGYHVCPPLDRSRPEPILEPFEDVANILFRLLVGVDDDNRTSPYLVYAGSDPRDCTVFWNAPQELIYRFPLHEIQGEADSFVMMAGEQLKTYPYCHVYVSNDNSTWTELSIPTAVKNCYTFSIPEALRAEHDLYVRFLNTNRRWDGPHIGGFAILGTISPAGDFDTDGDVDSNYLAE